MIPCSNTVVELETNQFVLDATSRLLLSRYEILPTFIAVTSFLTDRQVLRDSPGHWDARSSDWIGDRLTSLFDAVSAAKLISFRLECSFTSHSVTYFSSDNNCRTAVSLYVNSIFSCILATSMYHKIEKVKTECTKEDEMKFNNFYITARFVLFKKSLPTHLSFLLCFGLERLYCVNEECIDWKGVTRDENWGGRGLFKTDLELSRWNIGKPQL